MHFLGGLGLGIIAAGHLEPDRHDHREVHIRHEHGSQSAAALERDADPHRYSIAVNRLARRSSGPDLLRESGQTTVPDPGMPESEQSTTRWPQSGMRNVGQTFLSAILCAPV